MLGEGTAPVNLRVDHMPVQEELAAAKDAGNTDRFARLVIPHLNDAYTLARWITGNRIDAEDVVQEACLRAFRAISKAGDFNARAWMLGAVRSAAFAWLRKYRPASLVPPDEFGPVEHERMRAWDFDGATPEAALIAKTDAARLEAAIVRLPAPFREVLALRDIQGLSYREIAEITAVPVGTVMSRLARGRTRLIKLITRESVEARRCCARHRARCRDRRSRRAHARVKRIRNFSFAPRV